MDPLLSRQSLVSRKGGGDGWEKQNVISLKHNVQVCLESIFPTYHLIYSLVLTLKMFMRIDTNYYY